MRRSALFLALCLLLGGCTFLGGSVSHRLDMVIPASIPSVGEGKLVATLYAYDPNIADKSADELDSQEILFSHQQGTRTVKAVRLEGSRPAGFRVYVSAVGYERRGDEWVYVLWDSQTQTGMPRSVQMKLVGGPDPD